MQRNSNRRYYARHVAHHESVTHHESVVSGAAQEAERFGMGVAERALGIVFGAIVIRSLLKHERHHHG